MKNRIQKSLFIYFALTLFFFNSFLTTDIFCQDNQKIVELILDTSGSMNGKLPNGESKISAAKKAVEALVKNLPQGMSLAFRAYGHQFPREEHNCEDTQLLVDFGSVSNIRDDVIGASKNLKAQGYTPITLVLQRATEDFPADFKAEKTIILVSDGKETCEGDPCALAASLKKSGAGIVIHTIGLGVDSATKGQLECIASVSGGKYFPAANARDLIDVLTAAVETKAEDKAEDQGEGRLQVEGADISGHKIFNATTGEKLDQSFSHVKSSIKLPAGIYNVSVGKALWKSIEVKAGETTVLRPGKIAVEDAWYKGHKIMDAETDIQHASVSNTKSSAAVMPGDYIVYFGKATWAVSVCAGETVTLKPGGVSVKYAYIGGHAIFNKQGEKIGSVSSTGSWMPLPPGEYTIEIDKQVFPFTVKEGETVKFERK